MKISFSTLGCPTWNLEEVCERAREYGFDGIDLRGLQDNLDISALPAFTRGLAATARRIHDAGLAVSAISSGITLCDSNMREANIEEARRTIPMAGGLGCRTVRIFGGGDPAGTPRPEMVRTGAACMASILELDGARDMRWLLETHDAWIPAADYRMILDELPAPWCGALWDIAHTFRFAGETPAQTMASFGQRVAYVHIKDAVRVAGAADPYSAWRQVLPGTGEVPLAGAIRLLRQAGYDGWLVLEHEKRWTPELLEPEEIFPKFAAWARTLT